MVGMEGGVDLIEDNCHAHDGKYEGRKTGMRKEGQCNGWGES